MRKADSVESLMRSDECKCGENTTKEEDTLGLRRSFSEDLPPFPSNDTPKTSPKSRKSKSIKSRLSFRIRSLRDRRLLPRKTHSSDAFQQNSEDLSVDDLATESSLHSDLGSGEAVKKKRKLARKFLLGGIKWPKSSKIVDENSMTIATQTSPEVKDHTAEEVEGGQTDSKAGVAGKTNLAEPKQKLLITISGRKTEYKNPPSPKAADVGTHEGLVRLNITRSGKLTPPTERPPDSSYQESSSNLAYTVASKDYLQSEFAAQAKGLVQKSSSSARLERQASREEFLEEDKVQFLHHDLFLERGSRFPRPASHAPLKAPTTDERLSRVLDYVNETYSQNNNTPNAIEYEASTETPAQSISKVSDTPPLRDIQKDKNSSIFHSVNSNDSDDSPLSDAGRKRIKYVGQPTLYTDEEKEILEGRREGFRNLAGISEYSFESDFLNESQMPAFSDSVVNPEEAQIIMSGGEKREHLYKILVIGELGTGKTSFIKRYVHQFFSANYRATIGVDFALKVLHWDQNTIVRLQLWDIAGQERFGNMTRVYYKEAVGAFIVFDVTRSGTFDAVSKWKEDLDSKVQLPGGGPIPCILLANKCDQDKQGIVTNPEKMDEYVKENGFSGWFETSAKENTNIEEAARALVSQILLNDKLITAADIIDNDKFALESASGPQVASTVRKNCAC